MKEINYKSDFKIVERHDESLFETPFKFTFFIEGNKNKHIASYDGTEMRGCRYKDGELIIPIKGSFLGMGPISVTREFYIKDEDFEGGLRVHFSEEETDVFLGEGYNS